MVVGTASEAGRQVESLVRKLAWHPRKVWVASVVCRRRQEVAVIDDRPASLRTSRLALCSEMAFTIDGLDFVVELWRFDPLMTRQTRLDVNEFSSKPHQK